jgi:hypothetical protein
MTTRGSRSNGTKNGKVCLLPFQTVPPLLTLHAATGAFAVWSLHQSELSRMGRSVGDIITTVDTLVKQHIRLVTIKEGIRLERRQTLQTKVMVTLFGLFAEIERELISLRTKEGLAAARGAGKRLGRPPGRLGPPNSMAKKRRSVDYWPSRSPKPPLPRLPAWTGSPCTTSSAHGT